jgi:hypothetical protein
MHIGGVLLSPKCPNNQLDKRELPLWQELVHQRPCNSSEQVNRRAIFIPSWRLWKRIKQSWLLRRLDWLNQPVRLAILTLTAPSTNTFKFPKFKLSKGRTPMKQSNYQTPWLWKIHFQSSGQICGFVITGTWKRKPFLCRTKSWSISETTQI